MSCAPISNNMPVDQLSQEKAKGFLYKIKNEIDQTVGYLFGTHHNVRQGTLLDDKIITALSRSQSLSVEINNLDEKIQLKDAKENGNFLANGWEVNPTEDQLKEMVKQIIASVKKNPRSAEHLLSIKAETFNLPIESLETLASRKMAEETFKHDKELLDLEVEDHIREAMSAVNKLLEQIEKIQNIEPVDFDTILQLFNEGRASIELNIQYRFCISDYFENKGLVRLIISTIEKHKEIATNFYKDKNLKILESFYKRLSNIYVYNQDTFCHEPLLEAWEMNDKKMANTHNKVFNNQMNIFESKYYHLLLKETNGRDENMADQIHAKLLQSSKENRSFHAIGFTHIIGDPSFPEMGKTKKLLREKGWKIVNAYKKKEIM